MVAFVGLICHVKMFNSPSTLGHGQFHLFVSRQAGKGGELTHEETMIIIGALGLSEKETANVGRLTY
ncbi:unnamed protein product [Brassica oleracea var. botrytis]